MKQILPSLLAMKIKILPWLKLLTTKRRYSKVENNEDKLEWIF